MAAPWSSTGLLTGNKAEEFGKGSTYALRGKMTSSSPTETATTYTIPSVKLSTVLSKTSSESFTLTAQSISSVYVGVSIGGTTKLEYSGTSITGTKSGSIAIAKTHQSQSVTLSLRFDYVGSIVASYSGGGGWADRYGNSGLPVYGSHTFTVPAKTHYTVSFNANSGSGAPSAQTKWHGETLTLSSTKPTRMGYTFLGWSTSSTATSATYASGGSYTANAAAVLYAVWRINTWTVAYNANGGTGAPASQTKTYNQTLTLSSTRPARSGYTFLGWATKSDGTGTAYAPGGSYTDNAAATLYAVWVAVQVTSLSAYRSTSAGTRSDSGTYGHLSAGWKALGTIAGTVAVTATANDADVTSSLSNRSGSKTATADLSNTSVGTFGGSYAQDVAVNVSVMATLTVSYGGSTRTVTAQRIATIPKPFRLLDALHGGTGLAIGAIATLANTFEVALQTVIQNVVEVVQSNITQDGTYTEPTNGDHAIRLVDSSRRILSYLSAHKTSNSPNNYLRLTAYGPSGSKTANIYLSASDTEGLISTDCDLGTSLKQSASGRGYFLKDSAGHSYPGVYDNGENLWLGSIATASTHHKGQTYISAGHNGTSGNSTIYVSVPNAANNGGTNYGVYHTGNKPSASDVGALPIGGGTLTGGLTLSSGSVTTTTAAHTIKDTRFDRDGANPSADVWSEVFGFQDKNGESLGYLQAYQLTNGTTGLNLYAIAEDSSGGTHSNHVRLAVDKSGNKTYSVGDAAAFRSAIGAQVAGSYQAAGSYVTRNVDSAWINNSGGAAQLWNVGAVVKNKNNKTYSGHSASLIVQNGGISLYDGTTSTWVWDAYTTKNKPTPADIGAQPAGSYATTNCGGYINALSSTSTQQWYIHGKVNNSSNTARHNHDTWLVMNNGGTYCWDATAGATLWTTYTTANKPTPADIGAIDDVTTSSKTVSLPASKSAVSVTAPTVTGYTFVCWLQPAGSGHTNPAYMENASAATTNLYSANGTTTAARSYKCTALYKK